MTNLNQRPPTAGPPSSGEPPVSPSPEPAPNPVDFKRAIRFLLAGNPFFLISAATMLYGLYLVAIDPAMIREELSKLWFNVSSLEIYELMIVGTALLLARRKIWYDCNLLVTLENMFMFAPFILISQATLFDDGNTPAEVQPMLTDASIWTVSAIACGLAFGKLLGLRQVAILRIPVGSIVFGLAMVALNIFLPLYYRNGIAQNAVMRREASPLIWFAALPLAVVAAGLLPNLGAPGMLNQNRKPAFHFATVAFIAAIAALPQGLLDFAVPNFSREKMIILANGAYLLTLAAMMRRPDWSLFASVLFGFGIGRYIEYLDYLGLYAIQAGLLFLLIHSLCWKTRGREGWSVRTAAAVSLVAHSFVWGNIVNFRGTDIHVGFTIMLAGLLLIGAWFIIGRIRGEWGPKLIPWTGGLMIATVPLNVAIDFLKFAPKGHLTILASFLLFALGVAYALTRHRWLGEEKGIREAEAAV